MAKTETVEIPDELKNLANKALEQSDRFVYGVTQAHKSLPSDARKKLIKEQSLFGFLAPLWRELTPEQKMLWGEAATYSSITNWQLFISDNAARIRNEMSLGDAPSDLWQVNAGMLTIASPASEIILKQEHPLSYWVAQKVVGQSWKRELTLLQEPFALPLELGIRYKSDLTPEGGMQRARFFARIWASYQGVDEYTDVSVELSPSVDWTLGEQTSAQIRGILIGYTLYLEVVGYRGRLLFDNIRATHSGQNWARDPRCDNVSQVFSKAFAVVPPFWLPVSLSSGASFSSVYPPTLE